MHRHASAVEYECLPMQSAKVRDTDWPGVLAMQSFLLLVHRGKKCCQQQDAAQTMRRTRQPETLNLMLAGHAELARVDNLKTRT
jgi:hypothetical protein